MERLQAELERQKVGEVGGGRGGGMRRDIFSYHLPPCRPSPHLPPRHLSPSPLQAEHLQQLGESDSASAARLAEALAKIAELEAVMEALKQAQEALVRGGGWRVGWRGGAGGAGAGPGGTGEGVWGGEWGGGEVWRRWGRPRRHW